jgi:hypothetical protein
MAANLPSYVRFRRALKNPAVGQRSKLMELVQRNASSAFGLSHKFGKIANYAEFTRRVPPSDYENLEPWIARIKNGEQGVLTAERVTRLVPTSGSSGARKLIPFTAQLQMEFNAAVGPWLVDLARQFPSIIGGPAYWSITPALGARAGEKSAVPIGFDSDLEYLSAMRRRFARSIMAVPPSVARTTSLEEFHRSTWLHLLQAGDLRLISIWHPSFLTLLLDALPPLWNELMAQLTPVRQRELVAADPNDAKSFWPKLKVISCWGDANARERMLRLQRRFPDVAMQAKGLLATEGVLTLPFAGACPVAVASHFYEFISDSNVVLTVDQLAVGEEYQVMLTTGGGLWRYRLGDRVRVTGGLERTPTLEFIGRTDDVSDCCGEKLSERFVRDSLKELFGSGAPEFALLAPEPIEGSWRYTLYLEVGSNFSAVSHLDALLRRNPQYAYCRDLGQLREPRVQVVTEGFRTFAMNRAANGARLGDVKPACLSSRSDWSEAFKARVPAG